MLTFSVCPHDTQKELKRWEELKSRLEKLLGQEIRFEVLNGHEEEYERLKKDNFFDLYYAGPLVSLRLYEKGYKPVAKFKGQRNSLFLVVRELPEEGDITVAVPFLRPAVLGIMNLPVERVRLVFTKNFEEVFGLLKEGRVHAGIMYNETWGQIGEEEKKGLHVIEKHAFETSHLFMVKPEHYERVRKALLTFEELEPAGEEDIEKTLKLYEEFDRFMSLWSRASLARALEESEAVGVFIYSDTCLYANRAFLELVGYEKEEVVGKSVWELIDLLFPQDYKDLTRNVVKRRLSGEYFVMNYTELPLIRKDRRVVHTIASSQTVVYEGKLGGAVFFIDNTERKRLERLYAVIREVNQLIVQSMLEEELLQKICHVLVDRLGLRFVWIGVPDLKEERIKPLYSHGYEEGYLEEIFIIYKGRPAGGKGTHWQSLQGK